MIDHWKQGDVVLVRLVGHYDVLWGRPYIVVQDTAQLLALYIPEGTLISRVGMARREDLAPFEQRLNCLRLMFPGRAHSVQLFWDAGTGVPPWYEQIFSSTGGDFKGWKVDLESPYRRAELGFDTTDDTLDIIVQPDFTWKWKDNAALERFVDMGVYTREEAQRFYREGLEVVAAIEGRSAPFGDGWENWRPDPDWPVPTIPDNWSDIPGSEVSLSTGRRWDAWKSHGC